MRASLYARTGRVPWDSLVLFILPVFLLPGVLHLSAEGLLAQHPAEVQGRVVDGQTGQGLSGVQVSVVGWGTGVVSDGDGRIRIRSVPEGPVVLRLERMGYGTAEVELHLQNGQVTRFQHEMAPQVIAHPGIQVLAPQKDGRAGNTLVLDRDAIQASGARTLGELLEGRAGLMVVQRGPGGPQELQMRGGGSDQVLVLLDGVSLNDPVTGSADLSRIGTGQIERVQVLPGARSAELGAGALTGAILVETRAEESTSELSGRTGSLGQWGGDGTVARTGQRGWGLSAMGGIQGMDGSFAFTREPSLGGGRQLRRNADLLQRDLQLTARMPVGEQGEWSVRLRGDLQERGIPGKSFAPSDSARQSQGALMGSSRWLRTSADGDGRADLRVHHEETRLHLRDPAPPAGRPFDDRTRYRETGVNLRMDQGGLGRTRLEVGGDLGLTRREIFGEGLQEGVPRALDLGAGLRGGGVLSRGPVSPRITGAFRLHRDGLQSRWLPAHDLTVQLGSGGIQAHVTHRSSFAPPSTSDLFFREGVGVEPNPSLRAERIRGEWEVGLSSRITLPEVELHLSGQVFQGDIQDMIVWAPDFRFVWSPRNTDVERSGVEVQGELEVPSMGLALSGHLSSVRATYGPGAGQPGAQIIYRPRNSGGLSLAWRHQGWQFGVSSQYLGERHPVPAAANVLDGFWTVDLTAGGPVRLGDWIAEPRLRIRRLNGQTAPFIHAIPEPGRTMSFQLTFRHQR